MLDNNNREATKKRAKKLASEWCEAHPKVENVSAGFVDISGIWRGKRLPIDQLSKIMAGDMKLPLSASGVDIWGADPEGSELVFVDGDVDAICQPTSRGILSRSWLKRPSALVPLWMFEDVDVPFLGDPRQTLAHILRRFEAKNLRPTAAFELEFYVVNPTKLPLQPIDEEAGSINFGFENVLSLRELDALQVIFDEIYQACEIFGVKVDTLISEAGQGQFEVNFKHQSDILAAADEVVLFKTILRDVFNKHEMDVCFMAKTFPEEAGSGMHLHFSLLDDAGDNVFNDGSEQGSPALHHAVGGLIKTMPDLQLIFAPHLNSYRRYMPQSHAPMHLAWGYDNRMTAIRIPASTPKQRRIEHRLAGSDANPYLVLSAVLGGALLGMENQIEPITPVENVAELENAEPLATSWEAAIENFEASSYASEIFPEIMIKMILDIKHSEVQRFKSTISNFEYQTYMGL